MKPPPGNPQIVVIGAGHAGIEAAVSAARMGGEVTLLTMHLDMVAQMSCNPSIGGIAKGHLVKEIDALGGVMARAADATAIHFKTLNRSKGPAVRATRTQNDKVEYRRFMKRLLEETPGLTLLQAEVTGFDVDRGRVRGVRLGARETLVADAVVMATGTFLNGRIHLGADTRVAGRAGEPAAIELAGALSGLGLRTIRLKTGTPMRLWASTIDWSRFLPLPGDEPPRPFSLFTRGRPKNRIVCHQGHTNAGVKRVIEDNLALSPLYSGSITGVGPRYCPSIEDKIVKFPARDHHPFHLEPEGLTTREIYVGGLSTSLPPAVQRLILAEIDGLQHARMARPAYAVEYDALDATQLGPNLECREIAGLFFAGQVNGTSGYEEAAAQGLLAGINAVLACRREPPFLVGREEGYVGVMIDDLVSRGVDEPYRLFTARAEYRLQLREDNAFSRLGGHARRLGLLSEKDYRSQAEKQERRERAISWLKVERGSFAGRSDTLYHLLKDPAASLATLIPAWPRKVFLHRRPEDDAYVEAEVKYAGYIAIQRRETERLARSSRQELPADLDFQAISGLSTEVRQKLTRLRPATLGDAARIPGVDPASLQAISIHLTLRQRKLPSVAPGGESGG